MPRSNSPSNRFACRQRTPPELPCKIVRGGRPLPHFGAAADSRGCTDDKRRHLDHRRIKCAHERQGIAIVEHSLNKASRALARYQHRAKLTLNYLPDIDLSGIRDLLPPQIWLTIYLCEAKWYLRKICRRSPEFHNGLSAIADNRCIGEPGSFQSL